jgi:hypothetical protein
MSAARGARAIRREPGGAWCAMTAAGALPVLFLFCARRCRCCNC